MTFTPRRVDSADGVPLATRDFGGSGPALVLLHGAGTDQRSLEPLAQHLRSDFRVVTLDFRGHGGSGSAPWSVATAVQDVRTVAEAYGLDAPLVGGHSLGGMVALAYGIAHPACPGVINIDGHGRGRPGQYAGYDEAQVHAGWAEQDRRIEGLTTGWRGLALRALLQLLRQPTVAAETVSEVRREVDRLDLFAMYLQLSCPLLVFNATGTERRRAMRWWAGHGLALAVAFRQGLTSDLAALAVERPRTQVVTVDAQHMLVRTHPQLVAQRITDFAQQHVPQASA